MSRLILNIRSIRPLRALTMLLLIVGLTVGATACTSSSGSSGQKATKQESVTQQNNYAALVAADPAHTMTYSPTRKTINFWIDTWNKPGAKAYVYLQNDQGVITGYYVLNGPPVSMCTALTPTYTLKNEGGGDSSGQLVLPAPSVDGAYYSGGECSTYYGQDAATGAYIEYTVGLGINVLLYNQPLSGHPNVPNLAPSGK